MDATRFVLGLFCLLGLSSWPARAVAGQKAATAQNRNPAPLADAPPALYTKAQAEAGKGVYAKNCAACHGDGLQGTSGPAVGGTKFFDRAQRLHWSVRILRQVVVEDMPYNDPGTLSPKAYAEVLAFLLASDCYPAGPTPFPEKDTAELKQTKLTPPKVVKPDDAKLGTCNVK